MEEAIPVIYNVCLIALLLVAACCISGYDYVMRGLVEVKRWLAVTFHFFFLAALFVLAIVGVWSTPILFPGEDLLSKMERFGTSALFLAAAVIISRKYLKRYLLY